MPKKICGNVAIDIQEQIEIILQINLKKILLGIRNIQGITYIQLFYS